jgi:hypothetical protein
VEAAIVDVMRQADPKPAGARVTAGPVIRLHRGATSLYNAYARKGVTPLPAVISGGRNDAAMGFDGRATPDAAAVSIKWGRQSD